MLVKEWAAREGLHPQTVWKWCREGTMPVSVEHTPTGMWLIHDPKYESRPSVGASISCTVCLRAFERTVVRTAPRRGTLTSA